MSISTLVAVMERSRHTKNELLLQIVLAYGSGDQGHTSATVAELEAEARLSEAEVRLGLASLYQSGAIVHHDEEADSTPLSHLDRDERRELIVVEP